MIPRTLVHAVTTAGASELVRIPFASSALLQRVVVAADDGAAVFNYDLRTRHPNGAASVFTGVNLVKSVNTGEDLVSVTFDSQLLDVFAPGDRVTLSGTSGAAYDGNHYVKAVQRSGNKSTVILDLAYSVASTATGILSRTTEQEAIFDIIDTTGATGVETTEFSSPRVVDPYYSTLYFTPSAADSYTVAIDYLAFQP